MRRQKDWVYVVPYQWVDDPTDDQDETEPQTPKGLRAQLDKLAKENKKLAEENATLAKQGRKRTIAEVLKAKEIPAKVSELIPNDVEATPEGVEKWLADWSDVFGIKKGEGTDPEKDAAGTDQPPEDPDTNAEAAELARIARAGQTGSNPEAQKDLLKQIADPSMTQEKLLQLINAHGGGFGTG